MPDTKQMLLVRKLKSSGKMDIVVRVMDAGVQTGSKSFRVGCHGAYLRMAPEALAAEVSTTIKSRFPEG